MRLTIPTLATLGATLVATLACRRAEDRDAPGAGADTLDVRSVAARVEGRTLGDSSLEAEGFAPLGSFHCRPWGGGDAPRYAALCRMVLSDRKPGYATGREVYLDLVLFDQPGGAAAFTRFFHGRAGLASTTLQATANVYPHRGAPGSVRDVPLTCVKSPDSPAWCVIPIGSRAAVIGVLPDNGRGNISDLEHRAAWLASRGCLWIFDNSDEQVARLDDANSRQRSEDSSLAGWDST